MSITSFFQSIPPAFPMMFITGIIPEHYTDKQILSDALTAWALCHTSSPPEHFIKTMLEISKRLGVYIQPKSLMAYSEYLLAMEEAQQNPAKKA